MKKILAYFLDHWVKFTILLIVGLLIVVLYNTINNMWQYIAGYASGFFIGGFGLILFGLLLVCGNNGAFDIFGFVFSKKDVDGHRLHYHDYIEKKTDERLRNRLHWAPYLIVGGLYLIISIILSIILKSKL